jgi:23S rRNA pseudouridine1911/1915/1917 synthase
MDRERGAPLEILLEDNHLLCAVKPPGILSQPDDTGDPDMLTAIRRYLKDKYQKPGAAYLGLVHRLDRPVGGVMVFAKTSKAAGRLSAQIRDRRVQKTYRAVVAGQMREPQGRLEHIIQKENRNNTVRVSPCDGASERDRAVLTYTALAYCREADCSLVEITLITGRPHQIRAQFAFVGHPVAGDRKYAPGARQKPAAAGVPVRRAENRPRPEMPAGRVAPLPWPALWAVRLTFAHPVGQARVSVCSDPPGGYPWNLFAPGGEHAGMNETIKE